MSGYGSEQSGKVSKNVSHVSMFFNVLASFSE